MAHVKLSVGKVASLLVLSGCIFLGVAMGEELLKKGRARFLGRKISETQFVTCSGAVIEIGDGKVENTNRRCLPPPPSHPHPTPRPTPPPPNNPPRQ